MNESVRRFTPCQNVTDVSGQGVGMDAVKKTIEMLGGSVKIGFTDKKDTEGYRPFKLTFMLPLSYFAVDAYKQAS